MDISLHHFSSPQDTCCVRDIYELDTNTKLGEGGFSIVIKATRRDSHEPYAMKIYNRANLGKVDLIGLHQEVQILQSLKSTYIMGLYDVLQDRKYIYLVTELMFGGDLFDRISNKKYYVENDAREVCKRLLEAVAYCHSKRIAHRDLKPENLLLSSKENDSDIKVGDFGFAKMAESNESLKTKCGTPTYVAPEILLGQNYGCPVDMWSLGIIAYILLGGYSPFADKDQSKMYRRICNERPKFEPARYWIYVSAYAKDLIGKLLVVNPNERLTAEQALQHPWFTYQEYTKDTEKYLKENLEQLKVFNLKRKLRAAVYTVIAMNKFTSLGFHLNSMMMQTDSD